MNISANLLLSVSLSVIGPKSKCSSMSQHVVFGRGVMMLLLKSYSHALSL